MVSSEPYRHFFMRMSGLKPAQTSEAGLLATARDGSSFYVSSEQGPPPATPEQYESRGTARQQAIRLLRHPNSLATPKAKDDVEQYLPFPAKYLRQHGDLWAVKLRGEWESDQQSIVIVDTDWTKPATLVNKRVAVRERDSILIRWLRQDGKLFILEPQRITNSTPLRQLQSKGDYLIIGAI